MAAYAAAVSLMHMLDLIKNHPSPPISFDKQQLHSLTQLVTFLQEFLEGYVSPYGYSDEADPLEMRIADAVYAAEDVIESYIVDNIQPPAAAATTTTSEDDVMESYAVDNIQLAAASTASDDDVYDYDDLFGGIFDSCDDDNDADNDNDVEDQDDDNDDDEDEQIRYINFYHGLQKVIEAMDMIKKETVERERGKAGVEAELQRNVSTDSGSKSSSIESKKEMVGFEDELLQLKERLVGGDSNRQIIPIVGMGGIGKTTLARNVFADKLIKEHFDISLWATISQDYNLEQTFSELLSQGRENSGVSGLGEKLYKHLFNRRYLVVMDDIWSIEVWDKMGSFFPECGNGSRVIVTTRISNLATQLTSSSNSLCMSFMNKLDSWTLFSKIVFGSEGSFPDLELKLREIGEKIVGKCKGLPLSIAVIGGLLAKSELTQGYWEHIEKNLSSIVNLENEEYCLRVLKLSYNHLPAYLKPCFLYMGVFDEDSVIKVSTIINLWASEGFVKPKRGEKSLEIVAREYFEELVDRNLVIALPHQETECTNWSFKTRELGWVGMKKLCIMHDLVRDVSIREAQKQRFFYVYGQVHNPSSHLHLHHHRRIVIPAKTIGDVHRPRTMLESWKNSRSYVCDDDDFKHFRSFRLLRTLHTSYGGSWRDHRYRTKDVFGLVNARLLAIAVQEDEYWLPQVVHSSISRLWSLQTLLVLNMADLGGPVELWKMHQLKHVEFTVGRLRLQLPPKIDDNVVILENLHTLMGMVDFHLNEDVVTRIPNLRILDVHYRGVGLNREVHCLSYLQRLSKLESFRCSHHGSNGENRKRICFPPSLKQIILLYDYYSDDELAEVLQKLGRLPFLEELLIENGVFGRGEWETSEGQFPRLRKLELMECHGLKKWTVSEASHFPLLQKVILYKLKELEGIPPEIGEISTLKSVEVRFCSRSAVLSARKMVEEREDLYGEEEVPFHVLVDF